VDRLVRAIALGLFLSVVRGSNRGIHAATAHDCGQRLLHCDAPRPTGAFYPDDSGSVLHLLAYGFFVHENHTLDLCVEMTPSDQRIKENAASARAQFCFLKRLHLPYALCSIKESALRYQAMSTHANERQALHPQEWVCALLLMPSRGSHTCAHSKGDGSVCLQFAAARLFWVEV